MHRSAFKGRARRHLPVAKSQAPAFERRVWFRYVARCAALMAVLYLGYYYAYPEGSAPARVLAAAVWAQAQASAWLIHRFDPSVATSDVVGGTEIRGAHYAVAVVKDCASFDAQALLVASVLAFPVSWRKRVLGVGLGVSFMALANTLRIASLYFIGAYMPTHFDMIHEEIMPLVLVLVATSFFALWVQSLRASKTVAA
jgi:exosortase/archaeosortase family protein